MRSTCHPSDLALASLLGSVAVLPGVEPLVSLTAIADVPAQARTLATHVELPDSPPPRL